MLIQSFDAYVVSFMDNVYVILDFRLKIGEWGTFLANLDFSVPETKPLNGINGFTVKFNCPLWRTLLFL